MTEGRSPRSSRFQIWFEPDLKSALEKPARYADFDEGAFPVEEPAGGARVKRVIGKGAPIELDTPALAEDIALAAGTRHALTLPAGHVLGAVVIDGEGTIAAAGGAKSEFAARDFLVLTAGDEASIAIEAGKAGARLLTVGVPLVPGYPFYSER